MPKKLDIKILETNGFDLAGLVVWTVGLSDHRVCGLWTTRLDVTVSVWKSGDSLGGLDGWPSCEFSLPYHGVGGPALQGTQSWGTRFRDDTDEIQSWTSPRSDE